MSEEPTSPGRRMPRRPALDLGGAVEGICRPLRVEHARIWGSEVLCIYDCGACAVEQARRDMVALVAEVRALRARVRSAVDYADGLHFAGRLKDEKLVRAALAAGQPADPAELGGEG